MNQYFVRYKRGRSQGSVAGTVTVPNVSSISPEVGDTLGGQAVTITGTGFTGATSAELGGVPITNFVLTGDTTITGVTGARAAGNALFITVDGAGFTTGFSYWSPITPFAPTLFLEKPSYAVAAGTGTWTARVGTNFTDATAPPAASPAGTPNFVRTTSDRLSSAETTGTLIGLASNVGFTVAMVINVTNLPGVGAYDFAISDYDGAVGQFAVEWDHDGLLYLYVFDGGFKFATVTGGIVLGRNVIIARRATNGDLTIQSNGNPDSTATASGTIPSAGTVYLGRNPVSGGIARLEAKMYTVVTAKAKWSDANVAKYILWAAARHP